MSVAEALIETTHKNIKSAKTDMVLNRKNKTNNTKKPKQTNKQKHTKKKKKKTINTHLFIWKPFFVPKP